MDKVSLRLGALMNVSTEFVVCQPFGGRGQFLYLNNEGGLTPHAAEARRFESFAAAREHWRLAGPSATIAEFKNAGRASLSVFAHGGNSHASGTTQQTP
jgi:hypothetical protein